jgi:hypothetical protein
MALEQEFIGAVNEKNKRLVRIKLGNIITIDPTLKTFREMKPYAEQNIPDLYDSHSGELNKNNSAWTKEYYNEQHTELSFNFSKERLQHLCDVAAFLYGARIDTINENRARAAHGHPAQQAGGGALVGGAVLAGIGAIAKAPVLVGVGIAAAVIGAVILAKDSIDNK